MRQCHANPSISTEFSGPLGLAEGQGDSWRGANGTPEMRPVAILRPRQSGSKFCPVCGCSRWHTDDGDCVVCIGLFNDA